MALVKKRRPAVVKVKEDPIENEDIKVQHQDNKGEDFNEKTQPIERVEENDESQSLDDFEGVKLTESSKHKRAINGVISLVNTKSGKRLIIAKSLIGNINNPIKVVIGLSKNKLAIGEKLPANENYFTVKDYKGKGVIYSADLVKEISEKFKLDFSNRTTITFEEVEYIEYEDTTVAIITINNEEGNI